MIDTASVLSTIVTLVLAYFLSCIALLATNCLDALSIYDLRIFCEWKPFRKIKPHISNVWQNWDGRNVFANKGKTYKQLAGKLKSENNRTKNLHI